MTPYHLLQLAPMFTMCGVAAVWDLRSRRIPNWLTLPLMITGLARSFLASPLISPGQALAGLAVGFILSFILFALGALGGGDVKLLAGIGAWIGSLGVLKTFVVAAIIGMVIVVVQSARRGRLSGLLRRSALVSINVMNADIVGAEGVLQTSRTSDVGETHLPYAVPALIAVLLVAFI